MKLTKLLALVMALVMVFAFAACSSAPAADEKETTAAPETTTAAPVVDTDLPEIKTPDGIEFAKDFSITVNGKVITSADLKDCTIVKVEVETVNSKGNAGSAKYTGYQIADVLKVAGVKDAKTVYAVCSDGYESDVYDLSVNADYLILAVEKDKEMSEDGSLWFAPCFEETTGKYCSMVTEIVAE